MIGTLSTDLHWHTSIEQQKYDSFYYQQAWLDLITKLYGYSPVFLTTKSADDEITGFLPLCLMRSPLTGRRLVGLPFSDQCPLLACNETSAYDLIDQAIRLAQEQKVRYLELRSGINDALALRSDLVEGNLYVRWQLPLSADPAAAWSEVRKPVQRQVKKARKLGVQVRIAQQREDVAQYYRLHLQTRSKKHGMPAQPLHYFHGLWDAFAANASMRLLLAEYEGVVIAGMILLLAGSTVRYAYGASDERFLRLAPNDLLMWNAIELACREGYQTFDMGRTACDNEGLMEFKRRWGAIKEPLPYYYYPAVAGLASTSEQSWKYRLLTSAWKRLPLPATRVLGDRLYKHLG